MFNNLFNIININELNEVMTGLAWYAELNEDERDYVIDTVDYSTMQAMLSSIALYCLREPNGVEFRAEYQIEAINDLTFRFMQRRAP